MRITIIYIYITYVCICIYIYNLYIYIYHISYVHIYIYITYHNPLTNWGEAPSEQTSLWTGESTSIHLWLTRLERQLVPLLLQAKQAPPLSLQNMRYRLSGRVSFSNSEHVQILDTLQWVACAAHVDHQSGTVVVPSGKRLQKTMGKSSFLIGKSTISMGHVQ